MKKRVEHSTASAILSLATMIFLAGCLFIMPELWWFISWGSFLIIFLGISLYYCPLSLLLTDNAIELTRACAPIKEIPLAEIKSVRLHTPSIGAIRICGSGGFLGFWGWFQERNIGKYFAYYGKRSDAFLIELIDGRKYMLGCKNAKEMVDAINLRLSNIRI